MKKCKRPKASPVSRKQKDKESVNVEKQEELLCLPKSEDIEVIQDLSLPMKSSIEVQYNEECK